MIIGIDVGGTHADGVLLQAGKVLSKKKVAVQQEQLHTNIIDLLGALLPDNLGQLKRIQLSTTLCTNAVVNEKLAPVGMLIQAGPGMNADFFHCGEHVCFLDGSIDHRGVEQQAPDCSQLQSVLDSWKRFGVDSIGVVTKFSHRNSSHELLLEEMASSQFTHLSSGHRLSGMPNFPRRVYTTWLNGALKSEFQRFSEAITAGLQQFGVECPVLFLKADGGTMGFELGCEFPCQTVHSGPSASVLGGLSLMENSGKDSLLLDIGGTTTDIALFADGVPLLEPYGAVVKGRPTLVRSLYTKSIGLGGDSEVHLGDTSCTIGPEKKGSPMVFGGSVSTVTDALVVLGFLNAGEKEKAFLAMSRLTEDVEPEVLAENIVTEFVNTIHRQVDRMLQELFSRPVYSVSALLERKKLMPEEVLVVGGPAMALQDALQKKFDIPCRVPKHYEVANAVGAAKARQTFQISLYADSELNTLSIPELSVTEETGPMFSMNDAKERLLQGAEELAESQGISRLPEIDFVEQFETNTVRGFSASGKIISLKAQIRPGLDGEEI